MFDRREAYFPGGQSSVPLWPFLLLPCCSIISPFLHLILRQQGGLRRATTGRKAKSNLTGKRDKVGGGWIRCNAGAEYLSLPFSASLSARCRYFPARIQIEPFIYLFPYCHSFLKKNWYLFSCDNVDANGRFLENKRCVPDGSP